MKNFKVIVEDSEVKFFLKLLDNLNFVQYEQVENFTEPRIYPAADFEIHSAKEKSSKSTEISPLKTSKLSIEEEEKLKMDTLNDIRNVISRIDRMRDRSK